MTLVLSDEDRDFLQHYGVKGMKWGVRRSQAQLDRNAGRKPSRRERRRSRSQAQVSRNSATRSQKSRKRRATGRNLAVQAGKMAATRIVGKKASSMASWGMGNRTLAMGASVATDILSAKILVNTIQNQRDINRAD